MSQLDKLKKLKDHLKKLDSVLVAFSGGVDSAFLLKVAYDVLGQKVLAVTAVSQTYPSRELKSACDYAKTVGARHIVIKTDELKSILFRRNPENRCYYCKKELFACLKKIAKKYKLKAVLDGSNFDDLLDYRPGAIAKKEVGVISPLQEAGFTKKEIRCLSKKMGLGSWSKPALACLASRIPYGSIIDAKRLKRIDMAEEALRKVFNISGNVRVRDFGLEARIEVDKKDISKIALSKKTVLLLRPLGYEKIIVDPKGYRCGSLNVF